MNRSRAALLAASCALLVGLGGCAGDAAAHQDTAAAAALPLVTDGTLTIGTDPTYPPMEYLEGGVPTGANVELLTDLAHRLGLEPKFETIAFADLRPAAAAHRIDVIGASMTDKADRQEEVDFVDFFYAGEQVLAGAGDWSALQDPVNWCGLRGAAADGTTDADVIHAQSALCEAGGRAPIEFVDVPQAGSVEEILAGRADFGVEGLPAAAKLAADSGGTIQTVGTPWQAQPWGYGFAKDRTELRDALQIALQESIADGTYDEILTKYSVQAGALHTTAVNGGA